MSQRISRLRRLIPLILLILLSNSAFASDKVIVFAAASLKNALDEISQNWSTQSKTEVVDSYAASSALAKQIEQGAPADIFISADLDWMNYLKDRSMIALGSDKQLLSNQIILVAPLSNPVTLTPSPGFALKDALHHGKLAMANVNSVPAGKYGKAALETLGVWASVEADVVQAENVRAALKLVSLGEASLGIVYQTDALSEPQVRVVGVFPKDSHPPIIYPTGLTLLGAQNAQAQAFSTYLTSVEAGEIFKKYGFTLLSP